MRILTCDLLVADIITPLAGNEKLAALLGKYGMVSGGKKALDHTQFDEFSAAIEGYPVTIMPGGSSANLLTTLGKLMGEAIGVRFLGVAGEGISSAMIRKSLDEVGIALLPPDVVGRPAVSYVIVLEDGQRTIATWPGNARDIITPPMVSEALVEDSDVLLVQGSLWNKLDYNVADRLLGLGQEFGKALWLTLPTQGELSAEDAAHFRDLIPLADIVLGNDFELARLWGGDLEEALVQLQRRLTEHPREPVGFITCGSEGAAIITRDGIEHASPPPIRPAEIVNTLGAGDTAFAGFLYGYLINRAYRSCAQIGMALAGEKLHINGPRLSDPKASLKKALPYM